MNLYENIPDPQPEEQVDLLLNRPQCRVERIVSWGQTTPSNAWYDQEEEEWIVLLQGEASLLIEKDGAVEEVRLTQGDLLVLEKHQRHRVTYTSADPPCIWLCWFL